VILLCACAARSPEMSLRLEPAVRVSYDGLALDSRADRAEVRQRVGIAVREFCARHEDEITPDALRNDNFYCHERVRDTLVIEMPRAVRRAYALGLEEAGIRGRRL
jgi:UrcA family protein